MDSNFRAKNQRQFDVMQDQLQNIGRSFIRFVAEDLTERTPGFGNQHPETDYIPTGRLRGGLNYTRSPIRTSAKGLFAARNEEGPFSDYGRETVERIAKQVSADKMGGISYLENNVGYGAIIVRGEGNHAGRARDFPAGTAQNQKNHARAAINAVMRGSQ